MSETTENQTADQGTEETTAAVAAPTGAAQLEGLFAFKVGMSAVFENGERIPVTILKYEPMVISQVKTIATDGYDSVQVAFKADRASQTNSATKTALSKVGFENGAKFRRELRFAKTPAGLTAGTKIGLDSLKKGDIVKVTGASRGRGFQGPVRRWNFAGGPATHGSGFHRKPGSVGNRTWPGRVMPGKRMAGQWGDETVSIRNLKIVDVIPEENVVLVRGSLPGAPNSLVRLVKTDR